MTQHSHKLTTVAASSCGDEEKELFNELPRAVIFDADFIGQEVPAHFNSVKIPLEGTVEADLLWDEAKIAAENYVGQGLKIFWDMDLALFDRLKRPLTDHAQFSTLCLSLEHFRDTFWKQFQMQTVGICLYRGIADFYKNWKWDEEQVVNLQEWVKEAFVTVEVFEAETEIAIRAFDALSVEVLGKSLPGQNLLSLFCRDAAAEYLGLLARKLPDSLKSLVMLDGTAIGDPLQRAQLTINERYSNVHVAVKDKGHGCWFFAWEKSLETASIGKFSVEPSPVSASIGVCLPSITCRKPSDYQGLKNALQQLEIHNLPFRVVAENLLTTEWDGLDYLIVAPQSLSPQGLRKLRGFCAAGGTIASLGGPLGVDREVSVDHLLYKISADPHSGPNRY